MRQLLLLAALPVFTLTPDARSALDRISADSLRGNLSFLSSDLLEGRDTPSRGLDIAAEFIASQFRRASLEPAGDDGYFQTAVLPKAEASPDGLSVKLVHGGRAAALDPKNVVVVATKALDINEAALWKPDAGAAIPPNLAGKVAILDAAKSRGALRKLREARPAAILLISRRARSNRFPRGGAPEDPGQAVAVLSISGDDAASFYESLPPGDTGATATIHAPAPEEPPAKVRNVVAILRGSDPDLKDTCVVVSAHYDHLGVRDGGDGDRIFNGANDDGSGTVSVIELAAALSKLKERPRRSIVFAAFFGEEKGFLGSRYFVDHPVCSIGKTIADVNLEQLGRTDSSEGRQISNASVTGFEYSDVTGYIKAAGDLTGVRIYKQQNDTDLYFSASDNLPFADAGVPAHTICVAFKFPDYHGVGDEWPKIDYANMAKVDRMVGAALLMLASSETPPRWSDIPKTAAYRKKAPGGDR